MALLGCVRSWEIELWTKGEGQLPAIHPYKINKETNPSPQRIYFLRESYFIPCILFFKIVFNEGRIHNLEGNDQYHLSCIKGSSRILGGLPHRISITIITYLIEVLTVLDGGGCCPSSQSTLEHPSGTKESALQSLSLNISTNSDFFICGSVFQSFWTCRWSYASFTFYFLIFKTTCSWRLESVVDVKKYVQNFFSKLPAQFILKSLYKTYYTVNISILYPESFIALYPESFTKFYSKK